MSTNGDPPFGVLICDDYEAVRDLLRDVVGLSARLQVVGVARDGAEAISEAERLRPDMILLDLAMPGMTGIDALPELRRITPDARIIVISGFASSLVADELQRLGADGYIEKGATVKAILDALERAIA